MRIFLTNLVLKYHAIQGRWLGLDTMAMYMYIHSLTEKDQYGIECVYVHYEV